MYLVKCFHKSYTCMHLVNLLQNMHVHQWRIQDFPLGGYWPIGGDTDLRRVHFSVKTYSKMKEMDPVGRRASAAPPDPPMYTTTFILHFVLKYTYRTDKIITHLTISMFRQASADVDCSNVIPTWRIKRIVSFCVLFLTFIA